MALGTVIFAHIITLQTKNSIPIYISSLELTLSEPLVFAWGESKGLGRLELGIIIYAGPVLVCFSWGRSFCPGEAKFRSPAVPRSH